MDISSSTHLVTYDTHALRLLFSTLGAGRNLKIHCGPSVSTLLNHSSESSEVHASRIQGDFGTCGATIRFLQTFKFNCVQVEIQSTHDARQVKV